MGYLQHLKKPLNFTLTFLGWFFTIIVVCKYNGRLYNDIFYGLLIMNWSFGIIMLFISRAIMIKTFNEEKKFSLYFENVI